MERLLINVALTGCVAHKSDNPSLPITPAEVAADAKRCADLGAQVFHIHARNEHGSPTWGVGAYRTYVEAVRAAVPGAIVCVSCSGRNRFSFEERAEALRARPDMASLTLGSVDFEGGTAVNERRTVRALAQRMKTWNVVPECELFDMGHIQRLMELLEADLIMRSWINFIFGPCVPFSVYAPLQDTAGRVKLIVKEIGWLYPNLALGGVGIQQELANAWAIKHGLHVRTGLEDNLLMEKGVPATNMSLVERVVEYARAVGREPATIEEARTILGL